ncbi:MAG: hypothetical protein NVS1B4_04690 [Gemmatimonadaceae bacterium]
MSVATHGRRWAAALAVAAGLLRPVLVAQQPGVLFPVKIGITVQPETVTVGDPFVVAVRLRAPLGAVITFPPAPDSGLSVEALDRSHVYASHDSSGVDQTVIYRLVAWGVDSQVVSLGSALVRLGEIERDVTVGPIRVFVRSVLPADTSLRTPKFARDIIEDPNPWWKRWWWILPFLMLLALWRILVWRRQHRPLPAMVEDPLAHAEREFARVEGLKLLEAGERGRFVALVVEVLRDYLAARIDLSLPALTSAELLHAVALVHGIPLGRLATVLNDADLVKFARHPISTDRARDLAREARAIVRDSDGALNTLSADGPPSPPHSQAA